MARRVTSSVRMQLSVNGAPAIAIRAFRPLDVAAWVLDLEQNRAHPDDPRPSCGFL